MDQPDKKKISLNNNISDYFVAFSKAFLGGIPLENVPNAGPLMAELLGAIISNQRSDRFAKFMLELESRVAKLEGNVNLKELVKDERFTDLAEESIRHAVRAVSEERLKYIASLLTNGIKSEDINLIESKHLLRILGELNDIEIIWLRWHLVPLMDGDNEFRQKHKEILAPIRSHTGSSQSSQDKDSLQQSYKEHLAQLGLLKPRYDTDFKSKQPTFDFSGRMKIRGYDLTQLGMLLLKQINLVQGKEIR